MTAALAATGGQFTTDMRNRISREQWCFQIANKQLWCSTEKFYMVALCVSDAPLLPPAFVIAACQMLEAYNQYSLHVNTLLQGV